MLKGNVDASPRTDTATMLLQLLIRAAPNLSVSLSPSVQSNKLTHLSFSMQAGDGAEVHNVRGPRAYYTDVGKRESSRVYRRGAFGDKPFSLRPNWWRS